jgi:hypothetical protein
MDKERTIATINEPVAQKISTLALTMKNVARGPISKASLRNGFGADDVLADSIMGNI